MSNNLLDSLISLNYWSLDILYNISVEKKMHKIVIDRLILRVFQYLFRALSADIDSNSQTEFTMFDMHEVYTVNLPCLQHLSFLNGCHG